jgi:hypothetical protein
MDHVERLAPVLVRGRLLSPRALDRNVVPARRIELDDATGVGGAAGEALLPKPADPGSADRRAHDVSPQSSIIRGALIRPLKSNACMPQATSAHTVTASDGRC